MEAELVDRLQRMPIFGAIREDTLQFLLDRACRIEVDAGSWFFREGDPAESMFVLESGRVQVLRRAPERDIVLCEFASGDCFGEMALMDLHPRSASVRAVERCRAIEFGTAALHELYHRDAAQFALVQMNIGREVCRRLRATDDLLFRALTGERNAIGEPWFRDG